MKKQPVSLLPVRLCALALLVFSTAATAVDTKPASPGGSPVGSAGFNDMLGKQIKPGTLSVEDQPDGSFLLTNKLQTVSAHVTHKGVTFDSIGNSAGKGGFSLKLGQWGREDSLHTAQSSDIYKKDDAVYHTHTDGLAEKFSNTPGGIQQDFIVAVKPQGSGDLHIRLQVSDASVKQKDNGAIIALNSGRQLTYDRLAVTDAAGKTVPAEIHVAKNNLLDVIVHDADAQYPIVIDPTVGDQNWVSMGVSGSGFNGSIRALAVTGSTVYVGGNFTTYGSVIINGIAKWNGSNWSALGSGLLSSGGGAPYINAIAIDGSGNVYAGGSFTTAGGTAANNIARWNGSSWGPIGDLLNGEVDALIFDNAGKLYAGGEFTIAGGVTSKYIAAWNGSSWLALGSGLSCTSCFIPGVSALTRDTTGNIYVAGHFTTAGGMTANNIAKWNGSSWSVLGSGMNGWVGAVVADGAGNVYAGGSFTTAGGTAANNIARWNGSAWSDLGGGISSISGTATIAALAIDTAGNIYAGGHFSSAGGISVNNFASWNGANWSSVGSTTAPIDEVGFLVLDSSGNLYRGGIRSNLYLWNGSSWNTIGNLPINTLGAGPYVYAAVFDRDNTLYIAGRLSGVQGVRVNNIAKWDGNSWSSLGVGVGGSTNSIQALAIDSSGNLYAGGTFTTAGGTPAMNVAKWDGATWSSLGTGVGFYTSDTVYSMTVDSAGALYVGGFFTSAGGISAKYVAKWDGSAWSSLGSGTDGSVYAMVSDNLGNVYVGGQFSNAGGIAANSIAKWNGSAWSSLGSGMWASGGGTVTALAVDAVGNIYAGGGFTTAGGITANKIAKWDGSNWSALGSGLNAGNIALLMCDSSGNIYAGGTFKIAGNVAANRIAKWDGSAWHPLGSGMSSADDQGSVVNAMAIDSGGMIYAGGVFDVAGGKRANGLAKWDGSDWKTFGTYDPGATAPNSSVLAMAMDASGNVYVGGRFAVAGGIGASRIAKWNGTTWSALGWGLSYDVYALAVDAAGNVYAGGRFLTAGNILANNIAKWDGTQWSALGSGLTGCIPASCTTTVYALALGKDGALYVAGDFALAGDIPAYGIAKWDGSSWSALGSGLESSSGSYGTETVISALAFDNHDNLYAGGYFSAIGGIVTNSIAKWDGSNWSALGSGIYYNVYALAGDNNGNIYVGGHFSSAGGVSTSNFAKWNGSSWSAIGASYDVYSLAIDKAGNIYSGTLSGIFKWDGTSLSPLGSGINGRAYALALGDGSRLFVGGLFSTAGDKVSTNIAYWIIDSDYDGVPDVQDCFPFDNTKSTCSPGTYPTGTGFAYAPAGSYAINGVLTQCPAGTYNPNTGSTSSAACLQTPAGSYSGAGAAAPTQCAVGSYQPNAGSGSCFTAPAGSYVSVAGATVTTNCPAGTYNPNTGGSSISACMQTPAGSYSGAGAAAPTTCPAGDSSYAGTTNVAGCFADADGDGLPDAIDANADGFKRQGNTGVSVALADMDGDGYADILIGSPNANRVTSVNGKTVTLSNAGSIRIISGATGQVLNTLYGTVANRHFGAAFAVVADQDHDNIPDLVVGNPAAAVDVGGAAISNNVGNVSLYSGATGAFISSIANGTTAGEQFGASVTTGDVNNDASLDLIVGSPMANVTGATTFSKAGKVTVLNGLTNSVLYIRSGSQTGEHFGAAVAFNSLDKQLLIGSPGYDDTYVSAGKTIRHSDAGRVQIFDATDLTGTGANLFSRVGTNKGDHFGASVTSFSQDITGDAQTDWAVGIPGADVLNNSTGKVMKDAGKVQLFSGFNSSPVTEIAGANAGDNEGSAVSATGDINKDGINDLAIGVSKYDVSTPVAGKTVKLTDAGRVEVLSGAIF